MRHGGDHGVDDSVGTVADLPAERGEERGGEALGQRGVSQLMDTIDDVRTSPPPSVLAPVDLTDPAQVAAVMTIAARIGSILIANGTTSSDARASIHTVTSSYGLHYCHIDITVNTMDGTTVSAAAAAIATRCIVWLVEPPEASRPTTALTMARSSICL